MIGRTLAHYRITAAIGAGGMGQVYRATDTKLGREVAVKILPAEMASSAEMTERFKREARAVAALNHPSIVTIHSVEEADGVHFLTMELVPGRSLDQLIPDGGLEVQRILDIANALSGALAAAHDKGIVHRDLKPANVMVTDEGGVKVLDFGLAKFQGPEATGENSELSTAMKTSAGVVMGTRPYMSPEQVQGRTLDHRTDIFSMGVVLYEISTGKRPFHGQSGADLFAAILRDTAPPVTDVRTDLPADLSRVIRRCLEKDPRHRIQTARDVGNELRDTAKPLSTSSLRDPARTTSSIGSGPSGADEGFRIAVLPFKYSGADQDLRAFAEGLSEEIVTGLSRFSYLRVVAPGQQKGARYVMEGSLRQAGPTLRIAVQLVDVQSGAHLWADTYNRKFVPEDLFALQDELIPRIVSTVADMQGVLPRIMSDAVSARPLEELSPYEAVLRGFAYPARGTAEELMTARAGLERAVQKAPAYGDAWAMLAFLCIQAHAHGFDPDPDCLKRGMTAARRAVELAPSNHLGHCGLAQALFFYKEFEGFRIAVERAVALNPMDGLAIAFLAELLTYAGDSERGLSLAARAKQLNPHHPGWYWHADFYNAYRQGDDVSALAFALKVNMPQHWFAHAALAAAYGQLGRGDSAAKAARDLLRVRPDFARTARTVASMWWEPEHVERLLAGWRKAGITLEGGSGGHEAPAVSMPRDRAMPAVAIAVLPFSDLSPGKDQEYLCEGMAEEIMSALMGIEGLRVASRTSTFRARQDNSDLPAIARVLAVNHVLEGSVRTAGERLRVTAQLTDVATGFQVWSERFDRDARDVFAVQDEIAAGVVGAVRARLAPGATGAVPARSQVTHLEAYRHYLQGRHLRYSKNDHKGALRCFEAALALDPSHAPSMLGKAEVHVLLAIYSLAPSRESYGAARTAIETATRLQGETAEALYVLGVISICERDWSVGETSLLRAVELEPHNVRALCWLANAGAMRGRLEEARKHLATARATDPLAPYPYAMSGFAFMVAHQTTEALPFIEQALAFDPDYNLALWNAALALCTAGRGNEAVSAIERAATPSHRGGFLEGMRGWVLARAGRIEEARSVLTSLQSRPATAPTIVSEGWLLAALGETDAAFALFDRAALECQQSVTFWGLPPFDDVRNDPRFESLLTRLGLGTAAPSVPLPASPSGEARADEGFWVAVLPFKATGGGADLPALAEGLSEEIVTGFSRFSYLRVISRGATSRLASGATDVRAVAKEIGARFVMEGSLRQAGSRLRVAVQLTDAATGAHLWAETYDRPFDTGDAFALQDDLVPRIVSTCADHFGVLARAISEAVRGKPLADMTPYEALMRGFGYHFRLSPTEHAEAREALERAVERAPHNPDCWAMLSWVYSHEHAHGFNPRPGSLDRALDAARRAVDLAPSNPLAQQTLAVVLFFRKEKAACLSATERALNLNPLDGSNEAMFLITFSGDWERGCGLIRRAMDRNPHHPRWYGMVLGLNEYRVANYRAAVDEAVKANAPEVFWTHFLLAAAHARLGETEAARKALSDLLAQKNDFAESGEEHLKKWFEPQLVADLVAGLRKAGLGTAPGSRAARADEGFWVAVLPFKYGGGDADLTALAEGLSEEIVTGLSRFSYLRVLARSATARLGSGAVDALRVGQEIGARYVIEGSLRQAGARLRVAVQLTDAATGAHLWAETYDRPFSADDVFALQDDLVARIVSTVADQHGVLPHSMSGLIRNKSNEQLTPLEAVLRVFSFHERMSPEEHRNVRTLLERVVREHPDEGDCWAMLATLYADEYMFGFEGEPDPLARAQKAARRAVEVAPTNWLASQALAQSLFFRRELQAFRPVAERTIALNPMDSAALAFISLLLTLSGAWDRGLEVSDAARRLNPHFPGWYWLTPIFHAYHRRDYQAAIEAASRINMPGYFWGPAAQAAAFGQLGQGEPAIKAVNELLAIRPDFASTARDEFGKWFDREFLDHFIEGLVRAGLAVSSPEAS